jgi:ABC-2 type transport system ATP-binding protein
MNILKVKNVTKKFGAYKASNNISLEINEGSIYGLLGPNGAGKTTLIRMITNIYVPDEGEILLFGTKVSAEHQNRIGYLPEERGLYKKLKVIEQLIYFGQLKGMNKKDAQVRALWWLRRLDASDFAYKKLEDLSKGMSQKVQFVASLLHDPDFLILDEPFSGFDPINSELFMDVVLDLKKRGKTIILSSHQMHQVEQLCNEICLINKGRVLIEGNIREIKKSFGKNTVHIEFTGNINELPKNDKFDLINATENKAELKIYDTGLLPNELINEMMPYIQLYKFEMLEPSLNEIFIEMVKNSESGVKND